MIATFVIFCNAMDWVEVQTLFWSVRFAWPG